MKYDLSFRKHVLQVKECEGLSIRAIASLFRMSPNTVYLWTKSLSPLPRIVKPYKINEKQLMEDVRNHPDAFLHERGSRLGVTGQCVRYALKRLGVTYKKNTHSSQGDSRKTICLLSEDKKI